MRKKPNNKMIGLFIICGIALFFAIMGTFISDKILQDSNRMVVMYFSESIKGLDVGSPVVFKGVSIGKVTKIDIVADLDKLDFSIPVYVTFRENKLSSHQPREGTRQILKELVENGLRARLATQNYLTGQLMIELEFVKGSEAVYRARPGSKIPEIPTVLSQLAELSRGIQELPLRETFKKIGKFFDSLNDEIVPQMNGLMKEFSTIPAGAKGVPQTINNFNKAMQNISNAAKSLGNFADYIERHPEALLRGKGGY